MHMIDFHSHCFPDALASRALSKSNLFGTYETDATVNGLLELARCRNLRKCVVLHIANRPDDQRKVNQFAVEINGREDRIISFGSIHPYAKDALEELEWLYENGIRGIKFQPIRQRFEIDEEICRPIFRRIGELKMVSVIHGGGSIRTKEYNITAKALKSCIDLFQGNPVICSHMGGMFSSEKDISQIASMPVLTDTALCVRHLDQKKFDWAAEQFGPERILFGTDMPWACLDKEIEYVENSIFTRDEKHAIFDGNAQKIIDTYHL